MLIGRGENPLSFPISLVLEDQLFGMRVLAFHRLELQREYLTEENNHFMFDIFNWGIWDQDIMDSPSDVASQGIHYSAVMGKQLWRLISENTLCQECYKNSALFAQSLLSFLTYALLSYFFRLHCANIHTPLPFLFYLYDFQTMKTRHPDLFCVVLNEEQL